MGAAVHWQDGRLAGVVRRYDDGETYSIVRADLAGRVLEERVLFFQPNHDMGGALHNGCGFARSLTKIRGEDA